MSRTRERRFPWKWLVAALAIAALVIVFRQLPVREWAARLPAWAASQGFRGVLLIAAVYVACALLFGPAWLVTLAIGLTCGFARGLILVSIVSTLGAAIAFLIGRHLARGRVEELIRRRPTFAAVDRAIGRHGWKIVFLLRLSAVVPYTISNYVYGATAIRFWPYVAASWIGMLPITAVYVSIGAAGRVALAGPAGPGSAWRWVILGAGVLLTLVVAVFIARVSRRELARETREA
jgi:uncharacterized membrane protein YdjX (TVP38/TMEM64 family)